MTGRTRTRGKRPAPHALIEIVREQTLDYPAEETVFALSWVIVKTVQGLDISKAQKSQSIDNIAEQLRMMYDFRE